MGTIITALPAGYIEAAADSTGFAASILRRENMPARASVSFPAFRRGVVINSAFPVVAEFSFGGMIWNDKNAKIIAGARSEIEINAYKVPGAAPVAALPDLSTLTRTWSQRKILPYDSNLYTAKLADKIAISLTTGIFVVVLDVVDSIEMPGQDDTRRLFIEQSVNVSGVPADTQQEFFTGLSSTLNSVIQRLDTMNAELAGM